MAYQSIAWGSTSKAPVRIASTLSLVPCRLLEASPAASSALQSLCATARHPLASSTRVIGTSLRPPTWALWYRCRCKSIEVSPRWGLSQWSRAVERRFSASIGAGQIRCVCEIWFRIWCRDRRASCNKIVYCRWGQSSEPNSKWNIIQARVK